MEEESAAAAADRGVNFKLGSHTCLVIGWCSVVAAADLLLSISSKWFFFVRPSAVAVVVGTGPGVVEARTDDGAGSMDDLFWKALSSFLAGFMKATPSDGGDDDDVVGKDFLALLLLLSISWDINARVR